MNSRIATGVQDVVNRVAGARSPSFGQREWEQAKQCRTPGERLADGIGEPELFAAGKDEKAVPPPRVGENLQVGEELR